MDPITAGLFVAANFAVTAYAGKQQAKIEQASIKMQTEQARLQASESAYERSKAFRQHASTQLALRGAGFGSATNFAASTAESFSNYLADLNAINTSGTFAVAQGQAKRGLSKANQFANLLGATQNAATLASNLGLFENNARKKK